MADEPEALRTCEECGASIYPEHVEKGLAEADWYQCPVPRETMRDRPPVRRSR